jgi:hypothetical protein
MRATRAKGASSSGSVFAPVMPEEAKTSTPVRGPAPLGSVNALIALQEMAGSHSERSKGARRGRDLLDLLDEVRAGMLDGQVSRGTLQRLLALVNVKREDFIDPNLNQVLDEIDLRARVELAKLNFAHAQ